MKLKSYQTFCVVFSVLFLFNFAFAQAERDAGIAFYKQGNYRGAIENLKKATKKSSADAMSWSYLGLAYLNSGDAKNAIKVLKKAVELNPKDAGASFGLSYAYLMKNELGNARLEAEKTLVINPKSAEAHYIIGVVGFRNASYNTAYERAVKSISLSPDFAPAYLLRAESLISSFVQQTGTVVRPANSRGEILKEAEEYLEKYLSTSPANKETKFYQEYLESVKFFEKYYNQPENKASKIPDADAPESDNTTPIKILSKPRPSYTDAARQSGVQGVIRLLIGFSSDGIVKHILVVKPLSHGLNEAAVKAAREIKFRPATKDGKPVSVVKQVEYSFAIY